MTINEPLTIVEVRKEWKYFVMPVLPRLHIDFVRLDHLKQQFLLIGHFRLLAIGEFAVVPFSLLLHEHPSQVYLVRFSVQSSLESRAFVQFLLVLSYED